MKKELIRSLFFNVLLFISFPMVLSAQQKEVSDNDNLEDLNPQLMEKISELTEGYNKYRSKATLIYNEYGYDSKQMLENEQLMAQTDEENRIAAKAIFEEYGFPSFKLVGKEKSHEYWIIVLNCDADVDFQLAVLKVMDKLIQKDDADANDYAYLSDRVRINLGMKQVYGTQLRFNETSQSYEPYELNMPEEVDQRRAELKLITLANYIQIVNKKSEGTLKRKQESRRYVVKP
jgi:hypothetical protein